MSNTKDQTPVINSYRVMNNHRDNSVHTAESPDPVIQMKSIHTSVGERNMTQT